MPDRVVIVDDHAIFSTLVAGALASRGYRPVVADPDELDDEGLLGAADAHEDAVVVLDLGLGPRHSAYELIAGYVARGHEVVVLTASDDGEVHEQARAAGASAIVEKIAPLERFVEVLDSVARSRGDDSETGAGNGVSLLTPRERDVLAGLVRGRSVKDIASDLSVAVPTVRTQVRSIYRKLQVNNQRAAILRALDAGWSSLS
jgi:DNA-binding NarL/FixJ family response regulator